MAQDYAKKRKSAAPRKKAPAVKKQSVRTKTASKPSSNSGWRIYGAGVLTGVFLSFLLYLGSLPPSDSAAPLQAASTPAEPPPKPRFDFYTMLPEQNIDAQAQPQTTATPRTSNKASEYYLLQAGSFRQSEDADRRRAQLLLLGLEPNIEESTGDNGRWYRVYVGPFDTRSKMAKARSLTAAQNIDTLLLKRNRS